MRLSKEYKSLSFIAVSEYGRLSVDIFSQAYSTSLYNDPILTVRILKIINKTYYK